MQAFDGVEFSRMQLNSVELNFSLIQWLMVQGSGANYKKRKRKKKKRSGKEGEKRREGKGKGKRKRMGRRRD
jgi:hypothetical protein